MTHNLTDTIIALSTPPGAGAIGVIRLSGPNAITQVDSVFHGKDLSKVDGYTVHFGKMPHVVAGASVRALHRFHHESVAEGTWTRGGGNRGG